MYSQPQAFSRTTAASPPPTTAQARPSMRAFVDSMLKANDQADTMAKMTSVSQQLEQVIDMENAASKTFNVNHNETFTLVRHFEATGTPNHFAANPSALIKSPNPSTFQLQDGARFIRFSQDVRFGQNTFPFAMGAKVVGSEKSSVATGLHSNADVPLQALMRNPMPLGYNLYTRQNIDNFDLSKLYGWHTVTDQSIDKEIVHIHGGMVAELQYPGMITQIISQFIPDLKEDDIAYTRDSDGTVRAFVAKNIAENAAIIAKKLLKTNSFCDPAALSVEFIRADGLAMNNMEGVVDAGSGLNAFLKESIMDTVGTVSVTIEEKLVLFKPDS